jgi:glycosyltransferase involved in cell wall biosynthesis
MARPIPIFHSYPNWQLSGVNTWTLNLITSMHGNEAFRHRVLFTGEAPRKYAELDKRSVEYSFLEVPEPRTARREWKALKDFLEAQAPCVYLTNYDWHRSCAVDLFSRDVRVSFGVHSDESVYYDELRRLGPAYNTIFAPDSFMVDHVRNLFPSIADRTVHVRHGIKVPSVRVRSPHSGRLELIYAGRLEQRQKRILDLVAIALSLKRACLDFRLTIVGEGYDAETLSKRVVAAGLSDCVRMVGRIPQDKMSALFAASDIFVLVSDYEGACLSMMEAMSHGCVPVLYAIRGGVNDSVRDGETGFFVPHADVPTFVEKIRWLAFNRDEISRVGNRAAVFMRENFSLDHMASDFAALFERTMSDESRDCVRRSGRVRPPRDLTLSGKARALAKDLNRGWRQYVRHPLGAMARKAGWRRTPQSS